MIQNYIFDLYGTLVDIHTDQNKREVWNAASLCYLKAGAFWLPGKMKQAFYQICSEEEQKMITPEIQFPEIDLADVFRRLYEEAPLCLSRKKNSAVSEQWIAETAAVFRKASREKLYPYRNTVSVLKQLKKEGKGVWLLSNAQTLFTVEELKMCGLYDLFDGICISSEQGIRKPQKQFMERMLKEYDIDQDTALMIGNDIRADIAIACACGVRSVFLNTDCLSEEQIEKQLKETVHDETYRPQIVMNGDISQLLKPEDEYA